MNTPKSMAEINWNPDAEASRDTGGYSIGFTLTVLQVISFLMLISLTTVEFLFREMNSVGQVQIFCRGHFLL